MKERTTPTRVNWTETSDQEELDLSEKEKKGKELLGSSKEKASAETHVADIKRVLSSSANSSSREVNNIEITEYYISSMITRPEKGSLVDRTANGGVAGDDV